MATSYAQLVGCVGQWGKDSTTGAVTCSGQLSVVDNPPLSALGQHEVGLLLAATALALSVAAGVKIVRRFMGY